MGGYLNGKRVLVTGGTGLIGIPLVKRLDQAGSEVRVVSLDAESPFERHIEFVRGNLCDKEVCEAALEDIQVVFHLAGIKGGIGLAQSKAATFLIENILMNTQVMEAARRARVERCLYASSICIYPPAEVFEEKNAWTGFPHPSDKFGGMAKLVGEMQIEAYRLQYELDSFLIARPANTYGPYDNFDPISALIIPALIYRIFDGENPLVIWGDGSSIRDFVFADDVADVLVLMVEKNAGGPYNVGSGEPVSIKTVAETVVKSAEGRLNRKIDIEWDTTKPTGEKYRVASTEKVRAELQWSPKTDLYTGISKTIEYFSQNRSNLMKRYSILSEE